jgi:hypothetical protein
MISGRSPSGRTTHERSPSAGSSPSRVSVPNARRGRDGKRGDKFVKRRKVAQKLGLSTSLRRGTGGINECWKPSAGASKADLAEWHQEDLKLRRHRQLARVSNSASPLRTKSDDPAYRKSIWPVAKVARRASPNTLRPTQTSGEGM